MRVKFVVICIFIFCYKMFALDIVSLTPLEKNEFLRLNFNKGTLNIEKVSNEQVELYYKCHVSWGAWQISDDKRKVLIYEKGMSDLYLLDGNTGTIQYKGYINHSSLPDKNFKYLITTKLVPEDKMLYFVVLDLDLMKELYRFSWDGQRRNFLENGWMTFDYYRSLNKEFDFSIYACVEGGVVVGHALFNATTKEFVEYNDYSAEKVPEKTYYECGWE